MDLRYGHYLLWKGKHPRIRVWVEDYSFVTKRDSRTPTNKKEHVCLVENTKEFRRYLWEAKDGLALVVKSELAAAIEILESLKSFSVCF